MTLSTAACVMNNSDVSEWETCKRVKCTHLSGPIPSLCALAQRHLQTHHKESETDTWHLDSDSTLISIPSTSHKMPERALESHPASCLMPGSPIQNTPVPATLLMTPASPLPGPLISISAQQRALSQGKHGPGHFPSLSLLSNTLLVPTAGCLGRC